MQKPLAENRSTIAAVSMTPSQKEIIRTWAAANDMTFSGAVRKLALEAIQNRQMRKLQAAV
jgi:hypothetical protein